MAEVAVIVDHLVDGEAMAEQLAAVLRGGGADLGQAGSPAAGRAGDAQAQEWLCSFLYFEGGDQLLKEVGDAESQLGFASVGAEPPADFVPTPANQLFPVGGEKLVEHGRPFKFMRV